MNEKLKRIEEMLQQVQEYTLLAGKNVLTFDDVALVTGMSKSYLYKLTCSGRIPHYKPCGKMIYFDRKELEAWQKRHRYNSIDEAETTAAAYVTRKEGAV